MRSASVAKSYSSSSKISASGRNEIVVPGLLARLALDQVGLWLAALVVLGPDVALALDLEVEALGERVDDRDADAVQAAGDLVAAAVAELAAGVQDGEDDLGRGPLLLLEDADWDAAAVVDDGYRVVGVDRDRDLVAVAGERLVDGVVDDLVDEVVEAPHAGRADVHAGPLANGLEALEDGDVGGAVAAVPALLLLGLLVFCHSFLSRFPPGCGGSMIPRPAAARLRNWAARATRRWGWRCCRPVAWASPVG